MCRHADTDHKSATRAALPVGNTVADTWPTLGFSLLRNGSCRQLSAMALPTLNPAPRAVKPSSVGSRQHLGGT